MQGIKRHELKHAFEASQLDDKRNGRDDGRFFRDIKKGLSQGHLKPDDFSVRQLFEDLVPDGFEIVQSWNPRGGGGGVMLTEVGGGVDTSSFTNISGQIVFTRVREAFDDPEYLWPELSTTVSTEFNGERIPGIGRIGDESLAIGEGQPYPLAGITEEWFDTPVTTKRGFIVPLTKEAIFFDRTGIILNRAGEAGQWLGVSKEKRVMDVVTGQTNNFKYIGTEENTYGNTHTGFTLDNIAASNALVDWTDVETAEQLFAEMIDPTTDEPVSIVPDTLIVPTALKHTARRIVSATEIAYGAYATTVSDGQSSNNTVTKAASPEFNYRILTNAYVSDRQSSTTTWFLGKPKDAFWYMENWPITTIEAPTNNHDEFHSDIAMQWKATERGVAASVSPWHMTQSTA